MVVGLRQFRRWTLSGLLELLLAAFNDSGDANHSLQMIDGTIIRAYHCSTEVKGGTPRQCLGRSKGGFTTKILFSINAVGLPLDFALTGGRLSDYKGYLPIVVDDGPPPKVLLADKGYDADFIRGDMDKRGGVAIIQTTRKPLVRLPVDAAIYVMRNMIERNFNKLKNARSLATRYDKTADGYLGLIHIV